MLRLGIILAMCGEEYVNLRKYYKIGFDIELAIALTFMFSVILGYHVMKRLLLQLRSSLVLKG